VEWNVESAGGGIVFVPQERNGLQMITLEECRQWMTANLGEAFEWEALEWKWKTLQAEYPHHICYELPYQTGRMALLARLLARWCVNAMQPGLFWITCWWVWGDNMPLFDGYRKSLGEDRPIHAAPGHVFGAADLTEVECLLDLGLYSSWDASLFDRAGSVLLTLSHDGNLDCYANDKDRLSEIESTLERLKLKQV